MNPQEIIDILHEKIFPSSIMEDYIDFVGFYNYEDDCLEFGIVQAWQDADISVILKEEDLPILLFEYKRWEETLRRVKNMRGKQ